MSGNRAGSRMRGRRRRRGPGKGSAEGKGGGKSSRRARARAGGHGRRAWASTGDKVEVRSDEEGFIGAWYEAEVVHMESSCACVIEYEQLVGDDGFPLQELALLCNLRPRPPPLPALSAWLPGHLVEAYDRDGWWAGVVVHALPHTGDVLVRFRTTGEQLPFTPSLLRGLQNWDDGAWQDLTQAGRSDEDYGGDLNVPLAPVDLTEVSRKRGRPRKGKVPGVDLLSTLSKEMSLVIGHKPSKNPQALTDPHVLSIRSPNRFSSCEAPSMEALRTVSNVDNYASISALGDFAHHSDISQGEVRLELLAYELLVKALRLKGPLNWNQERMLADVRLHLNINNAEQTFILKRLCLL